MAGETRTKLRTFSSRPTNNSKLSSRSWTLTPTRTLSKNNQSSKTKINISNKLKECSQKGFSNPSNSNDTDTMDDKDEVVESVNLVTSAENSAFTGSSESVKSENVQITDFEESISHTFEKIDSIKERKLDKGNSESTVNIVVAKINTEVFDKFDEEVCKEAVNESMREINNDQTDQNPDKMTPKADDAVAGIQTGDDATTCETAVDNPIGKNETKEKGKNCHGSITQDRNAYMQKLDDKKVPESNTEVLNKTVNTVPNLILTNENMTSKDSSEEISFIATNKRKRVRRKRLISTSSQESNEASNDRKSVNKRPKKNSDKTSRKSQRDKIKHESQENTNFNCSLYNIEEVISEMQNKIRNLERKSILDEKKIETFKNALIAQRDNDMKLIMDEKENELLLRMDLLYLDYEPQRICRLCLLLVDRSESLTPLFGSLKRESLVPLIKNATGVQVEPEEGMPCGICDACLQQMRRIDWIKRRTQRSNELMTKFVRMKKNSLEPYNIPTTTMMSSFSDNLEDEVIDTLKIENVFSLESSACELQFVKQEPVSDPEESELYWTEYCPIVNNKRVFQKEKKCRRCSTLFTNFWSLKNHRKYCKKRFQCSECRKRFWNSSLLKRHKQRTQSCVSEFSLRYCAECDLPFRWKHQLLFHVIQHADVACNFCGVEYPSEDLLRRHYSEMH